MSPPPAGPADPTRVRQYLDIFAYCLDECAATRAGPHELFLWNARRLSEALLYALAEGTPWAAHPKPLQGRPMDLAELQRKLVSQGLIPSRLLGNLDTLRHCGNVAPLAQGPDTAAETATLEATRRAVVALARWFYSESALQEPPPEKVAEALRDLESEQPRTPRHHRTEMELRRLRRELDLARPAAGREDSAETAEATRQPGWRRAAVIGAAFALGAALGWALKPGSTGPAQVPAVEAERAPLRAQSPDLGSASAASVAEAPIAGADATLPVAPTPASPPAAAAAAPTPAEAAAPAAAEPSPAQVEPALEAAPDNSRPKDGECPAGAVAIPARRLDLIQGPSPRPAWPQPAPDPPEQEIPGFCIDRASVTAAAFVEWQAQRPPQGQPLSPASKDIPAQRDQPAQQVPWRQAQAYCRARGGDLPSVLQWEAALRHRTPPLLAEALGEWALDAFPPKAFGYAEVAKPNQVMYFKEHLGGRPSSRKPLLSWQRGSGRGGSPAVAFRCAWPVSAAGDAP